jgi:hypothetical protein
MPSLVAGYRAISGVSEWQLPGGHFDQRNGGSWLQADVKTWRCATFRPNSASIDAGPFGHYAKHAATQQFDATGSRDEALPVRNNRI